ncbi:hypothetical protein N781_18025 [Pontibacillus halophilus JSM 076056 = DSM 19796]|uniref:Helicase Helix-turn-helix domain-containing protein n=1 Tax=Pontibacillus halophilus JSM 076056 = DSM 19796 TaxID=1385510 RepID=A0A0A5GM95_9BACI|nr:helix-turn-helix domain-containing protein [Pontibacillus halophilus]KGX92290.1 hypothetical protein N781_18025 [Pontibacillus halophilus JSM 076056 = DSM 19796]
MFQFLLLHCITLLKGERTYSAIHHALIGKKSSQTFQDIHAYGLTPYYGVYKSLKRTQLEETLRAMQQDGTIAINEGVPVLAAKGRACYKEGLESYAHELTWFNGLSLQHMSEPVWSRLLLFVQTAANIVKGQHQFIPITDKPEYVSFVRKMYHEQKTQLSQSLTSLYNELYPLLKDMPSEFAELITYRFTSANIYGMSKSQLAQHTHETVHDVEVKFSCSVHYILERAMADSTNFPWLYTFIADQIQEIPITESAKKTLDYINQGYSLQQLTRIRRLKLSTIQDHIVEIALVHPSFSIEPFISSKAAQDISHQVKQLNTNRLKVIRESLGEQYSYFEIRLVLASLDAQ